MEFTQSAWDEAWNARKHMKNQRVMTNAAMVKMEKVVKIYLVSEQFPEAAKMEFIQRAMDEAGKDAREHMKKVMLQDLQVDSRAFEDARHCARKER